MTKNKYIYYGIFALLIIGIIFVVECVQQSSNQTPLSISYYYTTEGSSYNAQIENSKIVFTHADYEKIKDRCAQWIQQSPCWTQDDLITEEAQLTSQEIADLKNLIEETKIMQLETYYGHEQSARCYPHVLKIQEKEINYCSGLNGPNEPEAFTIITGKIQGIVTQKFSK